MKEGVMRMFSEEATIYFIDFKKDTYRLIHADDTKFLNYYKKEGSFKEIIEEEYQRLVEQFHNEDYQCIFHIQEELKKNKTFTVRFPVEGKMWKDIVFVRNDDEASQAFMYFIKKAKKDDVIQKAMDDLKQESERRSLYYEAIRQASVAMVEIDVTTDTIVEFDYDYNLSEKQIHILKASELIEKWASLYVEDTPDAFRHYLSREYIERQYEKGCLTTHFIYHSKSSRYIRLFSVYAKNSEGHIIALILARDHTAIKQRKERDSYYTNLIKGLAIDYENIFFIDEKNKTHIYRMTSKLKEELKDHLHSADILDIFADKYVYKEDLDNFKTVVDKNNILKLMKTEGEVIRFQFRVTLHNQLTYYEVKIINVGTNESPILVFGFTNVDKETKDRLYRQEFLKNAVIQMQKANKAKDVFLSNMSHDLRTPMNAIVGYADIAINHLQQEEIVEKSLNQIIKNSNHLLSLINDLLNVTRIESGGYQIDVHSYNLVDELSDLKDMIMVEMNKKDMHFETSFEKITHPYVECDFIIIRQVFQNILENAIKYTPKGGHIFFEVKPLHHVESGYETFECRIKDDGIGIEQSFLKHIYEPFMRSETSSTSNIPGTGLGMTIAKSLVTLLGGSIHIESEPGIGTEVILCFEMKLSHKEEEKESVTSHRDVTGLSVLLVEDNKMNSDIAKMILDEKGIHVEVAFNGKEALSMFKEHHYDLILMDLKMPFMNGYECAKEIRKESDVPIVAVSANAFEEDKQKAFMCGMNDYITKPYQIDELIKVIQKNT
ncbi:hypothetical protein IV49_GL000096 [Kandleria vitulina DSM 20405]|uniref:histidine kinase n=2 Tax=Kandleria vitulina TaxID=1630 RepID=A0A0R2HNI4_9FIRM|nr:hypothetical protein IV49_GL000096 [Kandleria vitulina DSM 20405]